MSHCAANADFPNWHHTVVCCNQLGRKGLQKSHLHLFFNMWQGPCHSGNLSSEWMQKCMDPHFDSSVWHAFEHDKRLQLQGQGHMPWMDSNTQKVVTKWQVISAWEHNVIKFKKNLNNVDNEIFCLITITGPFSFTKWLWKWIIACDVSQSVVPESPKKSYGPVALLVASSFRCTCVFFGQPIATPQFACNWPCTEHPHAGLTGSWLIHERHASQRTGLVATSPILHKWQRRSLRTESTTTQPPSADAGLHVATATSFRPLQQQNTFCSVSLLTRAVVAQQSHNKLCNWHADSSRRSIVQRSGERTAPKILSWTSLKCHIHFSFILKLAIFICKQLKRPVAFSAVHFDIKPQIVTLQNNFFVF